MDARETLVNMYKQLNSQLDDAGANKLVDDFLSVAKGMNRRQIAFLNLATEPATTDSAAKVGEYMRGVVPGNADGTRVPSRDLAVMLSILASVLVRLHEDKSDAMLADFAEATRVLVKLTRMATDNPLIDGFVKERVDNLVKNVEAVERAMGVDRSKDAGE